MSDAPANHPNRKRYAVVVAILVALGAWIVWRHADAGATPPAPAPAPQSATPAAQAQPAPPTTPTPPPPGAATAISTTATIEFSTSPAVNATVTWGNTRLGRITPQKPLVVVRPRDSGPLDVVVRAPGFMPVQTRAHTFADTKLVLRLTRPEQKVTLLGYRAPLDAGLPLLPDGGVPPVLSEMPPSMTGAPSPLQWPAAPTVAPMQTPAQPPAAPTQTPVAPPSTPSQSPAPRPSTPAPAPHP